MVSSHYTSTCKNFAYSSRILIIYFSRRRVYVVDVCVCQVVQSLVGGARTQVDAQRFRVFAEGLDVEHELLSNALLFAIVVVIRGVGTSKQRKSGAFAHSQSS